MDVDIPEVLAEMRAMFAEYERALISNDVAVLQELFRKDARTLRYGPAPRTAIFATASACCPAAT